MRAAIDESRALGRRLLWVFLLSICFAVMLVQMTDRVRHYLSEPVAVQVSVARNSSLTYPAITICNKVGELPGMMSAKVLGVWTPSHLPAFGSDLYYKIMQPPLLHPIFHDPPSPALMRTSHLEAP